VIASGLVVLILAIPNLLTARDLELCVENVARLDETTLRVVRSELSAILSASDLAASFADCRPGVVTIALHRQPSAEEPTALGRTLQRGGRLLPEIDIFVSPVSQLLGTNLPGVVGRALARVATHELGHLLAQEAGHMERGVMMERLSAAHLMARDRSFFRLPVVRRTGF
jgi:hypothetical protein